jgi:hypothetical protein
MTSHARIATHVLAGSLTLALALAGCGGKSSAPAPTTTKQARQTPALSGADVSNQVQRSRSSAAATKPEGPPAAASQLHPCRLVSVADAQSISHGSFLSQVEAPLGPTCIYKLRGSAGEITIAVETPGPGRPARRATDPRQLSDGALTAHCPTLGSKSLTVALPSGKVLRVTAPCPFAQPFALKALSRLAA